MDFDSRPFGTPVGALTVEPSKIFGQDCGASIPCYCQALKLFLLSRSSSQKTCRPQDAVGTIASEYRT
jgi:hypothetical protein